MRMNKKLVNITANIDYGMVRNDTLQGKEYLVVPAVMMVEGVHNGSQGSIYYSEEFLNKFPGVWNHKPAVVYHPTMNGKHVSACSREVLETSAVGILMNTKYEDSKLKTEVWLDKKKTELVDNRITEAIENNEVMEVSTGLYMEVNKEEGTWNNETYTAIAVNYYPDHLAILPDQIGACSVEDGAGLLRNQENEEKDTNIFAKLVSKISNLFGTNEMSQRDTQELLYQKLRKTKGKDWYGYIEDTFSDYFVYFDDGKMLKQDFNKTDSTIEFVGGPAEVTKQTNYTVINTKEIKTMDKEKFVKELISNEKTSWTEDDKESLMAMNEKALEKLNPVENDEPETIEQPKETTGETEPETTTNMTMDEYLSKAPEQFKEVLNEGISAIEREKNQLIEKITKVEGTSFTANSLKTKPISELRDIASLIKEETKPVNNYRMYGNLKSSETGETPLSLPTFNSGKEPK